MTDRIVPLQSDDEKMVLSFGDLCHDPRRWSDECDGGSPTIDEDGLPGADTIAKLDPKPGTYFRKIVPGDRDRTDRPSRSQALTRRACQADVEPSANSDLVGIPASLSEQSIHPIK